MLLAAWHREWEVPLHAIGATLLGVVAWFADDRIWWVAVLAVLNISGSFWVAITRGRRRLRDSEFKSEQLASQLDRRISELFSLQELSYVLSESIQLDRIVDQVARYAGRFLQTDGAIVVLADDERGGRLRVVAATGTLEPLLGRTTEEDDAGLVRFSISRERIEVAQGVATPTVNLLAGVTVRSAAVAPLRSQGVTMGALAVADRQGGPFTTEDLWLLSTVATNASVVLANSRLYEMVRRSKEEWETAFNALTEGIAVVGPAGRDAPGQPRARGAGGDGRAGAGRAELLRDALRPQRDGGRPAARGPPGRAGRAAGGAAGTEPAGAPPDRRAFCRGRGAPGRRRAARSSSWSRT